MLEITITDNDITIIRVPRGKENTFCTGISEKYTLSKSVRINLYRNDNTNIYSIKDKNIEDKNKKVMGMLDNIDDALSSTLDNEEIIKMVSKLSNDLRLELNS